MHHLESCQTCKNKRMQVGIIIVISPEHDAISDEVEEVVAGGVHGQVLFEEGVVAEVGVDMRDVGRLLGLVGVVEQRGGARLEERRRRRWRGLATAAALVVARHPRLQVQVLLQHVHNIDNIKHIRQKYFLKSFGRSSLAMMIACTRRKDSNSISWPSSGKTSERNTAMSSSETTSVRPLSFFMSPGRFLVVTWPPESLFRDRNCGHCELGIIRRRGDEELEECTY